MMKQSKAYKRNLLKRICVKGVIIMEKHGNGGNKHNHEHHGQTK